MLRWPSGSLYAAASQPWARLLLAAALWLPLVHAQTTPAAADAGVVRYDATRDAAADIARALAAAPAAGKHVLLIVGGDWCKDCRVLDALFAADPSLAEARDARYVQVKVFVGTENRNDAVLARYPKLDWVPTLIELDASGRALRAVPSTAFHDGDRLAPAKVRAFLHGGN
jgi:thiol:disulfide interchange protein